MRRQYVHDIVDHERMLANVLFRLQQGAAGLLVPPGIS